MNSKNKNNKKVLIVFFVIILIGCLITVYFHINSEADSSINIDSLIYPETSIDYNISIDSNNIVTYNEVINITSSGTYVFTGDYENTQININVDKTVDKEAVYIVLNNANITGIMESVINVIEAKDVVIMAYEDSINYISQTYSTSDTTISGAVIYSKSDLVINGTGTLYIDTNFNDGINSRDDLIIEDVKLIINSEADGIVGKDYIAVSGVNVTIEAGKDGIKTSNDLDTTLGDILIESGSFKITSTFDSISAEGTIQINGGNFVLESGGGYDGILKSLTVGEGGNGYTYATTDTGSAKSIKANAIIISAGSFDISSYEDAIHSDGDLNIKDGTFEIECGDDAIHANNNVEINGGIINVSNTYEGIEGNSITVNGGVININALDDALNASSSSGILIINGGTIYLYSTGDGVDSNGDLTINGGTIVIENEAVYTMGDYAIDVDGTITVNGGTIVDENGNDIDYTTVMHSSQNQINGPSGRR